MEYAEVVAPPYRILAGAAGLPELYEHYCANAQLVDEFELSAADETKCFFAVGVQGVDWPALVVAQSYQPAGGFYPGVLVVPETATVFIGASNRLLAYSLLPKPHRLWTDDAGMGFWSWSRYGDFVLMSAELELAAWTTTGVKLWSRYVDPPWFYVVDGDQIVLDVTGEKTSFPIGGP